MLAYELFTANKDSNVSVVKTIVPLKKIFFDKNNIKIQDTDSPVPSKEKSVALLQDWLSMHLNNAPFDKLHLTDVSVQSSQRSAYVRIYCYLEKKMVTKDVYSHKITLSIGKNASQCMASYDIDTDVLSFETLADVPIKINKTDYITNDQESLFDLYASSQLLNKDVILASKTFKKITTELVQYLKNKPKPDLSLIGKKTSFYLYVLPTQKPILKKEILQDNPEFTDAFGNTANCYPSATTQTAKFLSADDKAFTLNCTKTDQLYENLGIGDKSLLKVELPTHKMMWISGYEWVFVDAENKTRIFEQVKRGLLYQLYSNYVAFKKNPSIKRLSTIKVMCLERNQNKIEILLDENLTLPRQDKIFSKITEEIPYNALEIIIPKTQGKAKKDWSYYLHVTRAFLTGIPIKKQYFISYFTRQVKVQLPDMLAKEDIAKNYFERSDFLITYLSHPNTNTDNYMDDEEYAYKIGCIARKYIQHKREYDEQNNSLLGILQYSKYDQNSLRNVLSKIGSGIALSKANTTDATKLNQNLDKIERQIQKLIPENEITNTTTDYSYFFYKGYFTGAKDED